MNSNLGPNNNENLISMLNLSGDTSCPFSQNPVKETDPACSLFVYKSADINYSGNQYCGICINFRNK